MRDRALLHKSKLEDFRDWLIAKGCKILEPKSFYEVLRWKGEKGEAMPIIFDRHDAREHYTCNSSSYKYVRKYINERKDNATQQIQE